MEWLNIVDIPTGRTVICRSSFCCWELIGIELQGATEAVTSITNSVSREFWRLVVWVMKMFSWVARKCHLHYKATHFEIIIFLICSLELFFFFFGYWGHVIELFIGSWCFFPQVPVLQLPQLFLCNATLYLENVGFSLMELNTTTMNKTSLRKNL